METTSQPQAHGWESHRLAAQILRAWVRESFAQLPAWTPAPLCEAHLQLMAACDALILATQQAAREARRDA